MAARRTGYRRKKSSGRVPVSIVFWVLLFIVLIAAVFMLLPAVRNTWADFAANRDRSGTRITEQPTRDLPETPEKTDDVRPGETPPREDPAAENPPQENPAEAADPPPAQPPVTGAPEVQTPAGRSPEEQPAAETRDHSVYFMQLDRDGNILNPVKAGRKIRVSSTPLRDSLNALLTGPTAEEKGRRMDSFIPEKTRILSVEIKGNTAEINFNDEFQYNTFGREGIAAQLQQVVWTATEFPNVHNVQILINGKRIVFLSEGINIENPIGRQ